MVREEVCKTGFTGVRDGLMAHGIGLPPIIHHASSRLKSHGAPKLLSGVKIICLAISEPNAGLDASNITIKAVRDGADFIVNGELEYPMGLGRAFIRLLSEQAAKEEGAVTFAHPRPL